MNGTSDLNYYFMVVHKLYINLKTTVPSIPISIEIEFAQKYTATDVKFSMHTIVQQ